MKIPRFVARQIAALGGFFWMPCPRCGQMFGGHEIGGTLWDDETRSHGFCTCSDCPDDYVRADRTAA